MISVLLSFIVCSYLSWKYMYVWNIFMSYLKHEHEFFIIYETRGAADSFIFDKARIASVLNSFKNDSFYTHLVTLFTKELSL